MFVREALHRNEETDEVEPSGDVDEFLDDVNIALFKKRKAGTVPNSNV